MKKKQKIKNLIILSILVAILALSTIFHMPINNALAISFREHHNIVSIQNNLLVHFIDVGQGDAIAINFPNGKVLLIDAGPQENNVAYTQYLKDKVINTKRDKTIDYLILTHADADHTGGALKLVKNFDVNKIYMPILDKDTNIYKEFNQWVKENENYETVTHQASFDVEDCKIEIFGLYKSTEHNETCPVVKLTYLNKSFLFSADITEEIESRLISDFGNQLNADVLKVAHHGSSTSTSKNFVASVSPDFSVISVGSNNIHGHPTEEVLENLKFYNSTILRTDEDGNIMFSLGERLDLDFQTDDYVVTNMFIDYRIFVLVLEIGLVVVAICIVIKKPKNKHITK